MTDSAAHPSSSTRGRKIGVIGLPGAWSSERLADAFGAATGHRILIDCETLSAELTTGRVVSGDLDLSALDALVIKKIGKHYSPDLLNRLELLHLLQQAGQPVFSKPLSIMRLLNRLSCTAALAGAGLPMPRTVVTECPEEAARTIQEMGEAVFKPLFSTKARGMEVLRGDDPALAEHLSRLQRDVQPLFYLQKKLDLPDRDFSVVFIGGKHVGTYARVKQSGQWNTTTQSGGHYERHEPSHEVLALATRAQALFDMDLTSVDVVFSDQGPLIFEVSAFGGYRGLHESWGIDASQLYAAHVLGQLSSSGGAQ